MLYKNITSYILKNNIKFTMVTYFSSDNHSINNTSLPHVFKYDFDTTPSKRLGLCALPLKLLTWWLFWLQGMEFTKLLTFVTRSLKTMKFLLC